MRYCEVGFNSQSRLLLAITKANYCSDHKLSKLNFRNIEKSPDWSSSHIQGWTNPVAFLSARSRIQHFFHQSNHKDTLRFVGNNLATFRSLRPWFGNYHQVPIHVQRP